MADSLERCLASVAAQTYKDLEILLLDDGSSDQSPEICRKAAAEDPRIRVLSHPNHGVSFTRNRGIWHAAGDYLMFADSDDKLKPDMVERYALAAEESDADIIVGGIDVITDGKTGRLLPAEEGPLERKRFWELAAAEGTGLYGYAPNKLYRTRFLREQGIWFREDMKAQEDLEFAIRAYGRARKMALLRYSGYSYYRNGEFRKVPTADLLGNQLLFYREAEAAGAESPFLEGLRTRISRMIYGCLYEARTEEEIRIVSAQEGLKEILSLQGIKKREQRMVLNWFRKDKEKQILYYFRLRRVLKRMIGWKG